MMKQIFQECLFLSVLLSFFILPKTTVYAENTKNTENTEKTENPIYKVQESVDYKLRGGITHTFEKLNAGKTVNVAYLGGSITAANGWRPKTTAWLQKNWPDAEIHEIHAAISGTGSYLGLFRLQRDVLHFKPDLLFVEFAVNDGGTPPETEWRQIESIIRQTWLANPETDIIFVYTFCVGFTGRIQSGKLPQSAGAMEMLADYYGIPSVNFMKRVVEMESAGKLAFTPTLGEKFHANGKLPESVILWSQDGTHPLDAGHELYLQDIQQAFAEMEKMSTPTVMGGETIG
ncbi:MAG: SGNH/GDSL hydrolase family protein, partial [Planctomycetia bacterium]|nr:SGNH/GDSL hydrolase family protein [Planctomycetia bacterium]